MSVPTSLTLTLALLGMLLAGCSGETTNTLLQKGSEAVENGQWQDATKFSERVLRQDPNNVAAAVLQGISLHHLQRSKDAVEVLENAAQHHPNDFAAQYFYGWILWENQRFAEALTPLRRAYQQSPRHPDVLILLSRCCLQQNLIEGMRYLQALRQFRRYRERPEVYNSIAVLYFGQQEYQRAREYFLRALENDPRSPVILQNLAVLHDQYLQDPQRALYYYRHALSESQKTNDRQRAQAVLQRIQQLAGERETGS